MSKTQSNATPLRDMPESFWVCLYELWYERMYQLHYHPKQS